MTNVSINTPQMVTIIPATLSHLDELLALENSCFTSNQISRRSFRRFLCNCHSIFLIALDNNNKIAGYLLIIFQRGTRLARIYSVIVLAGYSGQGIARKLIGQGQIEAQACGALYYRLEVNTLNTSAITLYHSLGFKEFKLLKDYYHDHSDGVRMQKRICHYQKPAVHTPIPWLKQNTPFTCGPASLMMALSALDDHHVLLYTSLLVTVQ